MATELKYETVKTFQMTKTVQSLCLRSFLVVLILLTQLQFAMGQKIYSPSGAVSISSAASYCQGATASTINFSYSTCNTGTGSSSGSFITIKWYQNTVSSTSGGTVVSTTLQACPFNPTVTTSYQPSTSTPGTLYYYCIITWTGSGTCNVSGSLTSPITYVAVTAMPSSISGSSAACLGASTTLSNTVAGGTWSSSAPAVASVGAAGDVYGASLGTATITYAIGSCRATKNFSVVSTPAAITGTNSICQGAATTFSCATLGGTWSTSSSAIASINASSPVQVTGQSAGTATITYALAPSCYTTRDITVNTSPSAITGGTSTCLGTSVTLGNAVAGGTWSSSNTAKATIDAFTGAISTVAAGTTNISYTIGSCKSGMSFTVAPVPAAIGATATSVCEGATITFTNSVAGGTWSSSATATATVSAAGGVKGVTAGAATITYALGSCYEVKSVTVNTQPAAIGGSSSACLGNSVTMTNSVAGGTWSSTNSSKASINASGVVTTVANGTTVISYTIGSCASTRNFSVNAVPAAIGGTNTVCQGATRTYTNTVTGGTWSSSNNSVASVNASTGVITGVAPGTATITYNTGCSPVATKAITVYAAPAAITGSTSMCMGVASTLSNTVAGGVWATTDAAVATVNAATGVVSPVNTGAVTISYTIGGVCSTSANVTVNVQPSAITGMATICTPAVVTLANSVAGGSWSSSNTSILSVNSSTGAVSGVSAGTATITYAIGSCRVTTPLTASVSPVASISSAVSPCYNTASSVVFSGTAGSVITFNVDGGSALTQTLTGGTYVLNTGIMTASHYYNLVSVHDAVCTTNVDTVAGVFPIIMQWIGGATGNANNWSTAANWSCGYVPDSVTDVFIPAGNVYAPAIPASATVYAQKLTIEPGGILTIASGASLKVKDTFINNGTVKGNGVVVMEGRSAQVISGKGVVDNIKVNNANGVSIAADSRMMVIRSVALEDGNLTTNDSLLLGSDSISTAYVAPLSYGDTIKGQVRIYQYVHGGYRRYRFWSHPFSETISLSQVQKCIDITGQGGASNGFTSTSSNAASAYRFDAYASNSSASYDPGWKPFTKISASAADTNMMHPYQGIRLFVRGYKGQGLGYVFNYTPGAAMISMIGHINQGTQIVPMYKGEDTTQDYNMIGNPYASPVDIGTILYNAKEEGKIVGSAFYLWNPTVGVGGQYIAVPIGESAPIPYSIQAYTSFQVRAANDGDALVFTENNKTTAADNYLLKAKANGVVLNVYDTAAHLYDVLNIQFNDKATDAEDKAYDAVKRLGSDFCFYSIAQTGRKLAIDARPAERDMIVPLGVSSAFAQDYVLKVANVTDINGRQLYLFDKLLDKSIVLEQGAEYRFTVSRNKETQGDNRFELRTMPVKGNGDLQMALYPNPSSDIVKVSYTADENAGAMLRVIDITGNCVATVEISAGSNTASIDMSRYPSGIYMVELNAGSSKAAAKLIKE